MLDFQPILFSQYWISGMDALLFVSHKITPYILIKFQQIKAAFSVKGDSFLLLEENEETSPFIFKRKDILSYSWERLQNMGFRSIESGITPGSNHFITLSFFSSKPEYDNYWSIEYDVDFLGEWSFFFDSADKLQGDFVSCHIQNYLQNPNWFWWNSFQNFSRNPRFEISLEMRVKSFNPIYRISNKALKFIYDSLSEGVCGHHEVVIASLLYRNGFSVTDFGVCMENITSEEKKGLYIANSRYAPFGSMQHIPFAQYDDFVKWKDVLIHPIKI